MSDVPTEDVELLTIEKENYAIETFENKDKLSDENLNDDDELPISKKTHEDDKPAITKVVRIWHMEYYKEWFDMTTDLAIFRLKQALFPFKNEAFYPTNGEKPDLYCPFWITATLTVLIPATSNSARYESTKGSKENWGSDAIELMTTSSILAGFSIVAPLVLYLLLLNSTNPKEFVEVLSIYGYSLTVYLPAVALLRIPSNAFRWILLLFSAGLSASFLIRNLWLTSLTGWSSPIKGNGRITCLLVIHVAPILLSLVIKIYYFSF